MSDKTVDAFKNGVRCGKAVLSESGEMRYPYAFGRLVGYIEGIHTGDEIRAFLRGMDHGMKNPEAKMESHLREMER